MSCIVLSEKHLNYILSHVKNCFDKTGIGLFKFNYPKSFNDDSEFYVSPMGHITEYHLKKLFEYFQLCNLKAYKGRYNEGRYVAINELIKLNYNKILTFQSTEYFQAVKCLESLSYQLNEEWNQLEQNEAKRVIRLLEKYFIACEDSYKNAWWSIE